MSILLVALGGFLGSIVRFYISQKTEKGFIGTWIANITGSILLAIVVQLFLSASITKEVWVFLGVGFCGSYTTFSTFGKDTLQFLLQNNYRSAMIYAGSSLGLSLLCVIGVYAIF